MKLNAFYNGTFLPLSNIRIPLTDRGLFFGDGIYDASIGKCGKVFFLDEHINRFFSNADALDIPVLYSKEKLKQIILRLVAISGYDCFFVYFQLTRYSPERKHSYPKTNRSNLLITVTEQRPPDVSRPLKLITAEDVRHSMCNIKTLNLLPAVLASRRAEDMGCDEAVFVRDGVVTECSHSNVHIIKNSTLITHPLDNHILPGISRRHMLSVCERLGISFEERLYSLAELYSADAVLVSSSSKLAVPVSSVDDVRYNTENSTEAAEICREMLADFNNFH